MAEYDVSHIRDLASQWLQNSRDLYGYLGTMHGSVQSMGAGWTGKAGQAALVVWNGSGTGEHNIWNEIFQAAWAAEQVGNAINNYADELQKAVKEINKQHLIDALAAIFGLVLGAATLGMAGILEEIASAVGKFVEELALSSKTLAGAAAGLGGAAAFLTDQVMNIVITLATDLYSQTLASDLVDGPGTVDWAGEGLNLGLAVWAGAGMHAGEHITSGPKVTVPKISAAEGGTVTVPNVSPHVPTPTLTPGGIDGLKVPTTVSDAIPKAGDFTSVNLSGLVQTDHAPLPASGAKGTVSDASLAGTGKTGGGAPTPGTLRPEPAGPGTTTATTGPGSTTTGAGGPNPPVRQVASGTEATGGSGGQPPTVVRGGADTASGAPNAVRGGTGPGAGTPTVVRGGADTASGAPNAVKTSDGTTPGAAPVVRGGADTASGAPNAVKGDGHTGTTTPTVVRGGADTASGAPNTAKPSDGTTTGASSAYLDSPPRSATGASGGDQALNAPAAHGTSADGSHVATGGSGAPGEARPTVGEPARGTTGSGTGTRADSVPQGNGTGTGTASRGGDVRQDTAPRTASASSPSSSGSAQEDAPSRTATSHEPGTPDTVARPNTATSHGEGAESAQATGTGTGAGAGAGGGGARGTTAATHGAGTAHEPAGGGRTPGRTATGSTEGPGTGGDVPRGGGRDVPATGGGRDVPGTGGEVKGTGVSSSAGQADGSPERPAADGGRPAGGEPRPDVKSETGQGGSGGRDTRHETSATTAQTTGGDGRTDGAHATSAAGPDAPRPHDIGSGGTAGADSHTQANAHAHAGSGSGSPTAHDGAHAGQGGHAAQHPHTVPAHDDGTGAALAAAGTPDHHPGRSAHPAHEGPTKAEQWQDFKQHQAEQNRPLAEAEGHLDAQRETLDKAWEQGYEKFTEYGSQGGKSVPKDGIEAADAKYQWRSDITREFRAVIDEKGFVPADAHRQIVTRAKEAAYKYLVRAQELKKFDVRFKTQWDEYKGNRFGHGDLLPAFDKPPTKYVYDQGLKTYVKDDAKVYGHPDETAGHGPGAQAAPGSGPNSGSGSGSVDHFRDKTHDFNVVEQHYIDKREELTKILDGYLHDHENLGALPPGTERQVYRFGDGLFQGISALGDREHDIRTATGTMFDDIMRWNTKGADKLSEDLAKQIRLDYQSHMRGAHDIVFRNNTEDTNALHQDLFEAYSSFTTDELPGRIASAKFVHSKVAEETQHAEQHLPEVVDHMLTQIDDEGVQRVTGEYLNAVRITAARHFTENLPHVRKPGEPAASWNDVRDQLRSTLPDRVEYEGDLQNLVKQAAREFHDLVGHPDSLGHLTLHEDTASRLGGDFRAQRVGKYDELFAPEGHRTDNWLAHESRNEDGFQTRLDELQQSGYTHDLGRPSASRPTDPPAGPPSETPPPGGDHPAGPSDPSRPATADGSPDSVPTKASDDGGTARATTPPSSDTDASTTPPGEHGSEQAQLTLTHEQPTRQAPGRADTGRPAEHTGDQQSQEHAAQEHRTLEQHAQEYRGQTQEQQHAQVQEPVREHWSDATTTAVHDHTRQTAGFAFTSAQIDHARQELFQRQPGLANLPTKLQAGLVGAAMVRAENALTSQVTQLVLQHSGDYVYSTDVHQVHQQLTEQFPEQMAQLGQDQRANVVAAHMLDHKALVTEIRRDAVHAASAHVAYAHQQLVDAYGPGFAALGLKTRAQAVAHTVQRQLALTDQVNAWLKSHDAPRTTYREADRAHLDLLAQHGDAFDALDTGGRAAAVGAHLLGDTSGLSGPSGSHLVADPHADDTAVAPVSADKGKGKQVDRPEFVEGSSSGAVRGADTHGSTQDDGFAAAVREAYADEPALAQLPVDVVREAFGMQQIADPPIPGMRQRERLADLAKIGRELHENGAPAAEKLAKHLAVDGHRAGGFAGSGRDTVTAPVRDAGRDGHDTVPARPGELEAQLASAPAEFLAQHVMSMDMEGGLARHAPGVPDAADFMTRLNVLPGHAGHLPEHRFVLTAKGTDTAGSTVYALTPAAEWYVRRYGAKAMGLAEGTPLPTVRPDGEYLNAAFVPYLTKGPHDFAEKVGHARVPRVPGVGEPRIVVTPAMNGCAYAVTGSESPAHLTVWHYQSPDSHMPHPVDFRREQRPTDWFGAGEYYGGVPKGKLFEVANLMWHGDDGWEFVSQENHTGNEDKSIVSIHAVHHRPVALTPGQEHVYTAASYQSLVKSEIHDWDLPQSMRNIEATTLHRSDVRALQGVYADIRQHIEHEITQLGNAQSMDDLRALADQFKNARATLGDDLLLHVNHAGEGARMGASLEVAAQVAKRGELAREMVERFAHRPAKGWIGQLRSEAAPLHPKTLAAVYAENALEERNATGSTVNHTLADLEDKGHTGALGDFVRDLGGAVRGEIDREIQLLRAVNDMADLNAASRSVLAERDGVALLQEGTLETLKMLKPKEKRRIEAAKPDVMRVLHGLTAPKMEEWTTALRADVQRLAGEGTWHGLTPAEQGVLRQDVVSLLPAGVERDAHLDLRVQRAYDGLPADLVRQPMPARAEAVAHQVYGGRPVEGIDTAFVHGVNGALDGLRRPHVTAWQVHRAHRELTDLRGPVFTRAASPQRQREIADHLAGLDRGHLPAGASAASASASPDLTSAPAPASASASAPVTAERPAPVEETPVRQSQRDDEESRRFEEFADVLRGLLARPDVDRTELGGAVGAFLKDIPAPHRGTVVGDLRRLIDTLPEQEFADEAVNGAHKALNPFDLDRPALAVPGAVFVSPNTVVGPGKGVVNRGIPETVVIDGEIHVPVYTAVFGNALDQQAPGFKDFGQDDEGLIRIHTGSGTKAFEDPMWVSFGQPLRQVKWVAKYGDQGADEPMIRSFLAPLSTANEIARTAVTEDGSARTALDLNVDKHFASDQYGVRKPELLELLRRTALPGSLRTYTDGPVSQRPAAWGSVRPLNDLRSRLGVPSEKLVDLHVFTNGKREPAKFLSDKQARNAAKKLRHMAASHLGSPDLLEKGDPPLQPQRVEAFFEKHAPVRFKQDLGTPEAKRNAVDAFVRELVMPWATHARITASISEGYEELIEDAPDEDPFDLRLTSTEPTLRGERRTVARRLGAEHALDMEVRFEIRRLYKELKSALEAELGPDATPLNTAEELKGKPGQETEGGQALAAAGQRPLRDTELAPELAAELKRLDSGAREVLRDYAFMTGERAGLAAKNDTYRALADTAHRDVTEALQGHSDPRTEEILGTLAGIGAVVRADSGVDGLFVRSVNTALTGMGRPHATAWQMDEAHRRLTELRGAAFTRGTSGQREQEVAAHLAGVDRGRLPAGARPSRATAPATATATGTAAGDFAAAPTRRLTTITEESEENETTGSQEETGSRGETGSREATQPSPPSLAQAVRDAVHNAVRSLPAVSALHPASGAQDLDRHRPPALDRALPPAPLATGPVLFDDGTRLPLYMTGGVGDQLPGLPREVARRSFAFGQSRPVLRGADQVVGELRERLDGSAATRPAPPRKRDARTAPGLLEQVRHALGDSPQGFFGDGRKFVYRAADGKTRTLEVTARPYGHWERFASGHGKPVKVDTMQRSTATSGQIKVNGSSVGFAPTLPLGPLKQFFTGFGRLTVQGSIGKQVRYNQQNQVLNQTETRSTDDSHVHLDDVWFEFAVKDSTGRTVVPAGGPVVAGDAARRPDGFGFAVRDGLSVRIADSLTSGDATGATLPERMTLGPRARARAANTEAFGPMDHVRAWAREQAGVAADSTAAAQIDDFFSTDAFHRMARTLNTGQVVTPPLFRGADGTGPLGVFTVRAESGDAVLINETTAAELRDIAQVTARDERQSTRSRSVDVAASAGPGFTLFGLENGAFDLRILAGLTGRYGASRTLGTLAGGSASVRVGAQAKGATTGLYLVQKRITVTAPPRRDRTGKLRKAASPGWREEAHTRTFQTWAVERLTGTEARRLASPDPRHAQLPPGDEPLAPVYLTADEPPTLGMSRVEEFTFADGNVSRVVDGRPVTFPEHFADAVIAEVRRAYPDLVAPLGELNPHNPRWRDADHFQTVLHNTLEVLTQLSHQSMASNLETMTTSGLRIDLVESARTTRGHRYVWVDATLTGRRYEGTQDDLRLRQSAPGSETVGGRQGGARSGQGGVEALVSVRDTMTDDVHRPVQTGTASLGARLGGRGESESGYGVTATHEAMSIGTRGSHLYSYDLRLRARRGGHWRPRRWLRGLLFMNLLGTQPFVFTEKESALLPAPAPRTATTATTATTAEQAPGLGRVLLSIPVEHSPRPLSAQDSPAPATAEVMPPDRARDLALGTGQWLRDAAGQAPSALSSHPHHTVSVTADKNLTTAVEEVLKEASGGSWTVTRKGAPAHDAALQLAESKHLKANFDQSSTATGWRAPELWASAPWLNRSTALTHRTSVLPELTALTEAVEVETETVVGGTTQSAGRNSSTSTLFFGGQLAHLRSLPTGSGVTGSYALTLSPYRLDVSRSTTVQRAAVVEISRKDNGRHVLVGAPVRHEIAAASHRLGAGAHTWPHVPASLAGASGREVVVPGGWTGHLPEKSAFRLGVLKDAFGDVPLYDGRSWSPLPWLRDHPFASWPVNSLNTAEALRRFEAELKPLGLSAEDGEQLRRLVAGRVVRALGKEMTNTGSSVPARIGRWGSEWAQTWIGTRQVRLRVRLLPTDSPQTGFSGIGRDVDLEESRQAVESVQHAHGRSSGKLIGVQTSQGAHTTDPVVRVAGPTYAQTGSSTQGSVQQLGEGTAKFSTATTTQAHGEYSTGYELRLDLEITDVGPARPAAEEPGTADAIRDAAGRWARMWTGRRRHTVSAQAYVGELTEHYPLSLMRPAPRHPEEAAGTVAPAGRPDPLRPAELPAPSVEPHRVAVPRSLGAGGWHAVRHPGTDGRPRPFEMPEEGFSVRRVVGLDALHTANSLALGAAYDASLSVPANGPLPADLLARAKDTPLTRAGTGAAQSLEDGTSNAALTAFYHQTLTPGGYQVAGLTDTGFLGGADGTLGLYSRPDLNGARLLAVADGVKFEGAERSARGVGSSAVRAGAAEHVLFGGPTTSSSEVGTNQMGTSSGGQEGDSVAAGQDTAWLGSVNVKPDKGRAFLFAVPTTWLTVAHVQHHVKDNAVVAHVRGVFGSLPRGPQAVESEAAVVAWVREDVARQLGLIDDAGFPPVVAESWDAVAAADKEWTAADKAYWDLRRGSGAAREAELASAEADLARVSAAVGGDTVPSVDDALGTLHTLEQDNAVAEPAHEGWEGVRAEQIEHARTLLERAQRLSAARTARDTARQRLTEFADTLREHRAYAESLAEEYARVREDADRLTRWHQLAAAPEGREQLGDVPEPARVVFSKPQGPQERESAEQAARTAQPDPAARPRTPLDSDTPAATAQRSVPVGEGKQAARAGEDALSEPDPRPSAHVDAMAEFVGAAQELTAAATDTSAVRARVEGAGSSSDVAALAGHERRLAAAEARFDAAESRLGDLGLGDLSGRDDALLPAELSDLPAPEFRALMERAGDLLGAPPVVFGTPRHLEAVREAHHAAHVAVAAALLREEAATTETGSATGEATAHELAAEFAELLGTHPGRPVGGALEIDGTDLTEVFRDAAHEAEADVERLRETLARRIREANADGSLTVVRRMSGWLLRKPATGAQREIAELRERVARQEADLTARRRRMLATMLDHFEKRLRSDLTYPPLTEGEWTAFERDRERIRLKLAKLIVEPTGHRGHHDVLGTTVGRGNPRFGAKRQNVKVDNVTDLARGLMGWVAAKPNRHEEKELALRVESEGHVERLLDILLTRIHARVQAFPDGESMLGELRRLESDAGGLDLGTYITHYSWKLPAESKHLATRVPRRGGIAGVLRSPAEFELRDKVMALHDLMEYFANNPHYPRTHGTGLLPGDRPAQKLSTTAVDDEGRRTRSSDDRGQNPLKSGGIHPSTRDENAGTTILARALNIPVWAGQSFTAMRMFGMARWLGASRQETAALAWGIFSFWRLHYDHRSELAPHTLHETLDIAQNFGVPYSLHDRAAGLADVTVDSLLKELTDDAREFTRLAERAAGAVDALTARGVPPRLREEVAEVRQAARTLGETARAIGEGTEAARTLTTGNARSRVPLRLGRQDRSSRARLTAPVVEAVVRLVDRRQAGLDAREVLVAHADLLVMTGPDGGSRDHWLDPAAEGWEVGRPVTVMAERFGLREDERVHGPESTARDDTGTDTGTDTGADQDTGADKGKGKGKGKGAETFRGFSAPFPHTSRPYGYQVGTAGTVLLPNGVALEGSWTRFGDDFLHGRGYVLRGDSGWIGSVANWDELREILPEDAPRYEPAADGARLYLAPVGTDGRPVPLPLAGEDAAAGQVLPAVPAPVEAPDLLDPERFLARTADPSGSELRSLSRLADLDRMLHEYRRTDEHDAARRADVLDALAQRARAYTATEKDPLRREAVERLSEQAEHRAAGYRGQQEQDGQDGQDAQSTEDGENRENGRGQGVAESAPTPVRKTGVAATVRPQPLRYRERIALARREWQGEVADGVAELERTLLEAGPGARSLVMGAVPGEPLWAVNFAGRVRWLEHHTGLAAEPPLTAPDRVTSIDLDPRARLITPDPRLLTAGEEASRFCELTPGGDLRHVV